MFTKSAVTTKPHPACPNCGSRERVIRMSSSLTPFERPDMHEDFGGQYYCQTCAHDFVPELPEEKD